MDSKPLTIRLNPVESCDAAVIPVCNKEFEAYIPNDCFPGGVVVRNLLAGTDPELVKNEFLKFGPISQVEKMDGINLGGCHNILLTFNNVADARKAVRQMDNEKILGRRCRVHYQQCPLITKDYVERLRKERDEEFPAARAEAIKKPSETVDE